MAATTRSRTTTDIALIAGFAAIIAVCAILPSLKVAGPVPITLQTFGVLLAGAVLGSKRGFLAVSLYLVVGLAGLPVFSGGGAGPGVFAGPSVGYLIGFPLAAGLCGFIVERLPREQVALGQADGFERFALLLRREAEETDKLAKDLRTYSDAALDEHGAKTAFWNAFKAVGAWYAELPPY